MSTTTPSTTSNYNHDVPEKKTKTYVVGDADRNYPDTCEVGNSKCDHHY